MRFNVWFQINFIYLSIHDSLRSYPFFDFQPSKIQPAKPAKNYLNFLLELKQTLQKYTFDNEWKRVVEYFQNFISEIFEISMAEILCTIIYIYSGFFVISLNWYCYCPANQNYGFVDLSDFEFFCCKISKNLGSC